MNAEQISDFETALTRSRNIIDPKEKYISSTYDDFGISAVDVRNVLSLWRLERERKGLIDFEDMQEILYSLLYEKKDPTALKVVAERYNYLYLDEFQDISEIQYSILKKYIENGKKVVAIGDDDQTIYSWRGSSSDIITKKFQQDFEVTYNELNLNYRCPSVILESIIPSISLNENRFQKELKSARSGGELNIGEFTSQIQMGKTLVEMVKEDIKKGRKVTILGRTNVELFLPALLIAAQPEDIKYSLSNNRMSFDNPIGRVAKSIPYLILKKTGLEVSTALKNLVWDKSEVDKVLRVCKSEGVFFTQLEKEDLEYSYPQLAKHVRVLKELTNSKNSEVKSVINLYEYFIEDSKKGSGEYARNLTGVLTALLTFIKENQYNNVREIIYDIDDISTELKYHVLPESRKDMVRLATVHEYKGKEAPSVYIWNDSEGVFPYFKGVEHIKDLEEERRIHYIASTRASQKLTILTQRGRRGMFLKEMEIGSANNVSPKVESIVLT